MAAQKFRIGFEKLNENIAHYFVPSLEETKKFFKDQHSEHYLVKFSDTENTIKKKQHTAGCNRQFIRCKLDSTIRLLLLLQIPNRGHSELNSDKSQKSNVE